MAIDAIVIGLSEMAATIRGLIDRVARTEKRVAELHNNFTTLRSDIDRLIRESNNDETQ